MRKILGEKFFDRPSPIVARDLLGKYLVRSFDVAQDKRGIKTVAAMIIETEAYDGEKDLACHARAGQTKRNAPMFEDAGTIYVYFTYGMHWMLNLVCGKKEYPAAVLIRGLESVSGPARLTKSLAIDKALNTKKLRKASGLWVEDRGIVIPSRQIRRTPRIGVAYAGTWAKKPWRFVVAKQQKKTGGR